MAQIQFKGKSLVWNHHLGVEYHELVPDKSKSLTDSVSLKDNLIIHGDNLKALKALLPTYAGKVKCIYIDPPYNTGNEGWVYSDNVSSPMIKEWLGKVVDKDDLTRHDKWLCMMTPRLKLLRELLSGDGVILVSIDDNELAHLQMLMDEIFGEDNFICNIVWHSSTGGGIRAKHFNYSHQYVMCFARSIEYLPSFWAPLSTEAIENYKLSDEQGLYREKDFIWKNASQGKNQKYEIEMPDGTKVHPKEGYIYRFIKERFEEEISKDNVVFKKTRSSQLLDSQGKQSEWNIFIKKYLGDGEGAPTSLLPKSLVGQNNFGTEELEMIFGKRIFETPKSSKLLKYLLSFSTESDSIVLDSFAGSGTTGQAVLELNKEDGGNRKFILVEMEDYADRTTAERVRRVINGLPAAKNVNVKNGLGGSFSYFDLGGAIDEVGILSGKSLPSYEQMARYLFYTATGEEFDESKLNEAKYFIGSSKDYEVYLFYKPNVEYLKDTALNLDKAEALPAFSGKRRLVFAPAKYLDQEHLDKFHIDFAQLPFEIYKKA